MKKITKEQREAFNKASRDADVEAAEVMRMMGALGTIRGVPVFKAVKAVDIHVGERWSFPWKVGQMFILLGEIEQMPGHCILIDFGPGLEKNKLWVGYHTDNFVDVAPEDM